MNHTCLYCGSPCEVTLAMSSEGCSNSTCRAYRAPILKEKASEAWDSLVKIEHLEPRSRAMVVTFRSEPVAFDIETYSIGTRTGRLSSSSPNISNGPKPDRVRTDEELLNRLYGEGFPISKRFVELVTDSGVDPHTAAAAEMFGMGLDGVTERMRDVAKRVRIGQIYGARGKSFWHDLVKQGLLTEDELLILASRAAVVPPAELVIEHRHNMDLDEKLTHRWLPLEAVVSQRPGASRRRFKLSLLGEAGRERMARLEGTQGQLVQEWKRDAETLRKCEALDLLEKNMVWWPNTMRVLEDRTAWERKTDRPLLGVLSLVAVNHNIDALGADAIYDYISVTQPMAGRMRIIVQMLDYVRTHGISRVSRGGKEVHSEHFTVQITSSEARDNQALRDHHFPRIVEEFEAHRDRCRSPRNATMAEKTLLMKMRNRHG